MIVRARDGHEQVLDIPATDDLRSPMLDGFTFRLGALAG